VAARTTDSQTFVNSDGTKTVRLFDRPHFYKQGKNLVEIDTRVVADPANPGTFRSAANSWSVTFAPLDAGGVRVAAAKGMLRITPERGAAVAPIVGTGTEASTVTYPEVWPGADLRYRVEANRLKEDIVLRRPGAAATYAFSVEGASLKAKSGAPPGALVPDGPLADEVSLAPPEVQAVDGRPLDLARPTQVAAPASGGSRVVVGVDPAWLAGVAPSEYPVSLDPTVIVGAGAADWRSWKSDGYSCGPGVCAARVGNSRSSNYDTYYRSTIRFSYEAYLNQGARALGANLHLSRVGGTANGQWTAAYWADNWGYNQGRPCSWDGQFCGAGTTVWDVGDLDVTELYDFWLSYNLAGGSIFMQGAEAPGAYTFKDYAAFLDLTLDRPAPTATHTAPANASVVQTLTPTLAINPVYDPDGDGVYTWFRLSTSPDGESGQVFNTGWRWGATSATVPQGVLVDGRTYYWRVYTWDGYVCCNVSAPQSFRVDRRLGADSTQPFDQVGPASVNLASGNLVVATSGPSMKALGGDAGVSFTYNSQAAPTQGLTGRYANDANRNGVSDDGQAFVTRTDPQLSFNWGEGAPVEGMGSDWWTASWSGYLTAPVTGTYFFGATHDDGVTVRVNNQVVYAGGCCTTAYGGAVALSAGQAVPIQVDYNEVTNPAFLTLLVKGAVAEQAVPASWLTTAAPTLPSGWSLSAGDDVGWQWAKRGPQGSSVVLVDPTGVTSEYRWTGSGYAPPPGEDGILVANTDGTLTLREADGQEYRFNADGSLAQASTAADDRRPAALSYAWTGTPPKLRSITDPVSTRAITLAYGGEACPGTAPPGFDAQAPAGMACQVSYWDGTATKLWYVGGRLGRIEDPGGEVTDFAYDAAGRLAKVRDPLGADAVAAGVRADDDTTRSLVAYDGTGRVAAVTLPEPSAGAPRPAHSYRYVSPGETQVDVAGLAQPSGYGRKVTYDATGRLLTDTDATAVATSKTWDGPDRELSATDAAGRVSTTVYDAEGRISDTYGPAPASCFTNRVPNGSCANPPVGHTRSDYDQGMTGLAAAYWPNTTLTGAPKVHATGVGDPSGALVANWGSGGPPGLGQSDFWSARYTGEITLPAVGTYTFYAYSDDGVRVFIDDTAAIDDWSAHYPRWSTPGTFNNTVAGSKHRIRVEHFDQDLDALLHFYWVPPGQGTAVVPGANLAPRYGLVTRTTTDDSAGVPAEVAATAYANPENGLPTAATTDPGGLGLTTTTAYEAAGAGYLRRTSRTLPAGNANTYAYYGATETMDNPCTGQSDPVTQAGLARTETGPDPDGAGPALPRVEESVYDAAGRPVATRVGTEAWTCVTYDARGRVTTRYVPAYGGEPARTITSNYAVGGDPLKTSVADPAGTITTTVDLLGRVVSSTDVWAKTSTTTYDQVGRVTQSTGPAGTLVYSYDAAGRVETLSLDGALVADPAYNAAGREVSTVGYGNATSLSAVARDGPGRLTGLTWALAGGSTVSDQVTRSQSGKVIDQATDGVDAYPAGANFAYDGAGRLTSARVPGHAYTYEFASSAGCGPLATAGKNTNRTRLIDNGVATTSCYDAADRLVSMSPAGPYTALSYDTHGNTTTLGAESHGYDGADRHVVTTKGTTTVRYTRDALDRIVARSDATAITRYAYAGGDDSPEATLDTAGIVIERLVSLPGGVLVTKRAGGDTWSYPNVHGDVVATASAVGAKQGPTLTYSPYGEALTGLPDNAGSNLDYGWLGQHQRPLEHDPALIPTIEMGARQYVPGLGRFLEVDPVEGGSANNYEYCLGDPTNCMDLGGQFALAIPVVVISWKAAAAAAAASAAAYAAWRASQHLGKPSNPGISPSVSLPRINLPRINLPRIHVARGVKNTGKLYPNRRAAESAARRDARTMRRARYREECGKGGHVHVDIYNAKGRRVTTRHYRYRGGC
jgi:RHS repeat-associated protein